MSAQPTGDGLPSYRDLLRRTDAPPGSTWGLFGASGELGTLNHITPERTRAAMALVRTGEVFTLDYPLNTFVPSIAGTRPATEHHLFANNPNHRDDWLDSFYLQSTSQIDGLRHMRHPRHGFYDGVADTDIDDDSPALGIQAVAQRGIVGRGVLLDVARGFATLGRPFDVSTNDMITPHDLDQLADVQGVELEPGDILLLRLGWAPWFLSLPIEQRPKGKGRTGNPGLIQSEDMLAWLWDRRIAMVAADNSGLEATPVNPDSGWIDPDEAPPERGPSHNGMLHRPAIALLGLYIGELWALEQLADSCAADGRYEFLLTAKPLNVIGGVGSPPNAMAVK
jgi:putative cyclase